MEQRTQVGQCLYIGQSPKPSTEGAPMRLLPHWSRGERTEKESITICLDTRVLNHVDGSRGQRHGINSAG
jgi:hypothetical protein